MPKPEGAPGANATHNGSAALDLEAGKAGAPDSNGGAAATADQQLILLDPPAEVTVEFKSISCWVSSPRGAGPGCVWRTSWPPVPPYTRSRMQACTCRGSSTPHTLAPTLLPRQVPKSLGPPPTFSRAGLRKLVGLERRKDAAQAKSEMRQVLFSVTGTCEPGEMLALMGPSGGGKVRGASRLPCAVAFCRWPRRPALVASVAS